MPYYDTCPICGGSLDPGETCDCQDKQFLQAIQDPANRATVISILNSAQEKNREQRPTG